MATHSIQPNDRITFKVYYEDASLLVVGKPAHIVTLPGKGHEHDTLLNALFARYGNQLQNMGRVREFGLLHRLDRETSGLVIVALRPSAYDAMLEAFRERAIAKFYWAVTKGTPEPAEGVIQKPILEYEGRAARDPRVKKIARVSPRGKPAVTAYRVIESATAGALVECRAVTGRLHQVRVHMDSIGCPILGDDIYGPTAVREASPRLALHAHRVAFPHPLTGERVDVGAPMPEDLKPVLKKMGLRTPSVVRRGASGGAGA
ncbi:MAG: RluA family pseudouridine synthase [Phycisphaerales bacterium]